MAPPQGPTALEASQLNFMAVTWPGELDERGDETIATVLQREQGHLCIWVASRSDGELTSRRLCMLLKAAWTFPEEVVSTEQGGLAW